jgi:pyruvate dehydrogenase E2 component (dihydrolipoamide acetyltransferase)
MLQDVVVPQVSDGVTSGSVIDIAVAVGDQVEADQTLLELETDKAVVAIPAPAAGTIREINIAVGDQADVGAVIMVIEVNASDTAALESADAEAAADGSDEEVQPETISPAAVTAAVSPAAPVLSSTLPPADLTSVRRGNDVAPAAPSVRRFARELGVDIYQISGTGPGGRISEADVRAFVKAALQGQQGTVVTAVADAQRELPDFSRWGAIESEPFTRVREITADAMAYSWRTNAMVTQYDRVRIDQLEQFRKEYNSVTAAEDKLTMTAILLRVCAAALKKFPQFNSSVDMVAKELILKRYIHIGVAVDTPKGLLVPVLRDVDQKGMNTLASELNDLALRTREGKITPAEMEGGTFTISNLGGIGGTSFTPLVYAPQVAILGVSRAEMEPVWNGSAFLPKLTLPLSLTYDHRVIDGAAGARFLRWICEAMQNPMLLLMD